jgi:pimeloyl-ACP methyl ester carboxylesterase
MSFSSSLRIGVVFASCVLFGLRSTTTAVAEDWTIDLEVPDAINLAPSPALASAFDSPTFTTVEGLYDVYWPALRHKWAAPPYSVVCYLYGAGGEFSRSLQHPRFLDFVTRTGCVLIVPRYQSGYGTFQPSTWQAAAEARLQAALRDHGRLLDPDRFAIVGHSIGGLIALRMAADRLPGIPAPRAVVLHDGAGFEFSPLLATRPEEAAAGFRTAAYDDFRGMPRYVQLLALVARETWDTAHDADDVAPPEIGFGNENAGGVLSRAAWCTPAKVRKHFLRVNDMPIAFSLAASDHDGPVIHDEYAEIYWRHTADMLAAAFSGRSYTPDLSGFYPVGEWARPEVTRLSPRAIPRPSPFAWNCALLRPFLELGLSVLDPGHVAGGDPALERAWEELDAFLTALPCD